MSWLQGVVRNSKPSSRSYRGLYQACSRRTVLTLTTVIYVQTFWKCLYDREMIRCPISISLAELTITAELLEGFEK